jgi:hypothetical protein
VTKRTNSRSEPGTLAPANLAIVLAAVESHSGLSESRRRDLRSAVMRVAHLLGNPRSRRLRNPDQLRRRERYRQTTSPEGVKFGSRLTLRPSISAFAPDRTLPTPVF